MAKYFCGRRQVGQFEKLVENGRGRIDCEIFEEWVDIDLSTTAYCGAGGSCVVERSVGLSEKVVHTLKSVIEASIGIKDLLSLKSQVEETIGREVNWSVTDKATKTFTYNAPKCGRYTLVIYELTRIYVLTYYRKKLITFGKDVWTKKWSRTLPERTNNHDGFPDYEEYHEACNCPGKKESPPPDGYISFDMGRISFRAPYRLTDSGFAFHVGEKKFEFTSDNHSARDLDYGFSATIPASMVPEPLLFLGEVTAQKIEGRIQKYVEQETKVFEKQIYEVGGSVPFVQAQGSEPLER